MKKISIIVAMAKNRVIGDKNKMLWHLPEDLKFFARTTKGHTVIMGRKTFESIGKALPKRQNIIISKSLKITPDNTELANTPEKAIELAKSNEVFIIGGGEIYKLFLEKAQKLYLTFVDIEIDGETKFPELNYDNWQCIKTRKYSKDEKHTFKFEIKEFERTHGSSVEI